ncbi:hypothetical protein WKH86_11295 [Xanthomonas oryzae pv. oryzae]|nr:hypothetical protein [Xanthomonas oryzae]
MAQSGRALVRPDHPTGDQAQLLRLGGRSKAQDQRLRGALQSKSATVQMDCDR